MKSIVPLSKVLLERGLVPDLVIRFFMRQLLAQKIFDEASTGVEASAQRLMKLIAQMKDSPIAVHTKDANAQHYELPTEFFQLCLGKNLKYSSCYYPKGDESLSQAEDIMLDLTVKRAEIENGQDILELGCGWGSLSLYMAQHFPNSRITAVSNSKTQKSFIDAQAFQRGLKNLEVITCDMNELALNNRFDRIVSVEMFEHMRNWQALLQKAASFLKPEGKLFIHIFTHSQYAYLYDAQDESDFIGRYFFTGGIMPSDSLLLYFQEHVQLEEHWRVSGRHYAQTSEHWLANMDSNKDKIMPILKTTYGDQEYVKWWHYWRIFYMACAELWGYKQGSEWIVSHYRFIKI